MAHKKTIPLPPVDYDLTAQAMFLAQHLKTNGFPALAALLVKREKAARKVERDPRRAEVTKNGRKVRGGRNHLEDFDWHNPDIVYEEKQ